MLNLDERGQQLADLVGQRGVAPDVLCQRRPLPFAETPQERLQDRPQPVAGRARSAVGDGFLFLLVLSILVVLSLARVHFQDSEAPSGRPVRISLRRRRARM